MQVVINKDSLHVFLKVVFCSVTLNKDQLYY